MKGPIPARAGQRSLGRNRDAFSSAGISLGRSSAARLLFFALLLFAGFCADSAQATNPPVQLVSARRYYTLFLSTPTRPGEPVYPQIRYQGVWECVNWGATGDISLFQQEPAHLPYLAFRAKANGVPVPVEKQGDRYWVPLHFPGGERVRVQIESLQQVLPVDPSQKIDSFEDLIQPTGWKPPIVNYWIVVDLGRLFTAYMVQESKSPAFGLSPRGLPSSPPPSAFPEFLANRILQVSPKGYRIEGSKIWWYYHNLGEAASSPRLETLRVVWQAWYR
ncbi:hypothetical protein MAMC_01209 [Methylacidimicrobium cyclopophantes]|uniref:Uncharacterized protein n=1 Tax=Methylacidimicrobium cyclopophantes TaxID=1041766 RepID=A0A5E6MMU2_9BACT|nr:hypothetical protein [Methylacidimicrobium cyclopophantes]VVM06734.1 hypothetical protein MAMC_01209 [Methylacidimicrobium cyclopophantes]